VCPTDPSGRPRDVAISLRGVGVIFPTPAGLLEVLRDVTLTVSAGEFVSVVGPSGCGKSTLLRVVADILKPTTGEVIVAGADPATARRRRAFGFVFQDPTLLAWRTVLDNVMLPLEISSQMRRGRDEAAALLELVGLKGFEHSYPWQLSGGMRQRVSIARALVTLPEILLLDEPFGALDEITRERLNEELLRIWHSTQTTVLFVTHSAPEATFLSDRVLVLTNRPARVKTEIGIQLARRRKPEVKETEQFIRYTGALRRALQQDGAPA
jgi:NitT/TauT family transport system ATP-binding protein